jgi:hypothetical protein
VQNWQRIAGRFERIRRSFVRIAASCARIVATAAWTGEIIAAIAGTPGGPKQTRGKG